MSTSTIAIATLALTASCTMADLDLSYFRIEVLPDPSPGMRASLTRTSPSVETIGVALIPIDPPTSSYSGAALWDGSTWRFNGVLTGQYDLFVPAGLSDNAQTVVYLRSIQNQASTVLERDGVMFNVFPPPDLEFRPENLSGNGRVITGWYKRVGVPHNSSPLVIRDGVPIDLGEPSDRYTNGYASFVSHDGSIVTGVSESIDDLDAAGNRGSRGWVWSNGCFTLIPRLHPDHAYQAVNAVSSDGRFFVGHSSIREGVHTRGWIWSPDSGLFEIPSDPGQAILPIDVSADGTVVIGLMGTGIPYSQDSFIWSPQSGLVSAADLLLPTLQALVPDEIEDISLLSMNDEASRIVGTFTLRSNGLYRGIFILRLAPDLPDPGFTKARPEGHRIYP